MRDAIELPAHVARAVEARTAGQRVLWVGRPAWKVVLRWGMLIWLVAVPWTVFSVGWTLTAAAMIWGPPSDNMPAGMRSVMGVLVPLWGVPFVVVGLGMLASPFWMARKAYNTAYAVTDQGLVTLVASPSGAIEVRERHRGEVQGVELFEWRDGSGTVKVHVGWKTDSDGDRVKDEEQWLGIPDAARVERLVRSMIRRDHAASA